jgi:nucleoside-diphosphate-sugar epimerase
MKILVAGGAGYVGSRLVPELMARGYDIDVVDLFWFGDHLPKDIVVDHHAVLGYKRKVDIFDLTEKDLAQYDQVIFMAGLSNDPMAEFSPSKNFIFNAAAPAYLAYIAKRAGVKRLVYACSCSVYGYTVDELFDENSPTACGYPYGISKLQGEQAVLSLQDEKFSVISLRKGTVSGYSPRMRLDLIVNTMFKCAVKDGVITVNNPAIWRPILGIADAVNAYVRAIESNQSVSGIFNVASENYTVGEIADLVREHVGTSVKIDIKHVQDFRNYKVTWDKAKTILSFHPRQKVEGILRELSNNVGSFQDWDNPNYFNIQVLRSLE